MPEADFPIMDASQTVLPSKCLSFLISPSCSSLDCAHCFTAHCQTIHNYSQFSLCLYAPLFSTVYDFPIERFYKFASLYFY